MSKKKTASLGGLARDERGDPSQKALQATIVVCLVGLVALYLFASAPRKAAPPTIASPSSRSPQAKESVASFDRASLSTKNR